MIENDNKKEENSITEETVEEKVNEENKSAQDIANETEIEEDAALDKSEEIISQDSSEITENEQGKTSGFFGSFLAAVIDELIVLGVSVILLFLSNFIMGFLGYYIAERTSMFIIIFLIVNIIYTSVMEVSKLKGTVGKIITGLKIYNIK